MSLVFLILASFMQLSFGTMYKVGGSAGWTTIGNVDYKQWAANKTFVVGDVIVFKYSPQFYNVMQVTLSTSPAMHLLLLQHTQLGMTPLP
ncbi:hypothetical protein K7X08_010962 [Anisodus acutangulus]|uniref:Phytocyanin domain-containing protein n=1 Tax=Anisodus acutangulus TaxID=402998 RepID=A0A9Q1M196_9SOLA|nr:hypothetical protein K7X08_010962 [Anisodus acutangulus]